MSASMRALGGYPSFHGVVSSAVLQLPLWSLRRLHFSSDLRTPPPRAQDAAPGSVEVIGVDEGGHPHDEDVVPKGPPRSRQACATSPRSRRRRRTRPDLDEHREVALDQTEVGGCSPARRPVRTPMTSRPGRRTPPTWPPGASGTRCGGVGGGSSSTWSRSSGQRERVARGHPGAGRRDPESAQAPRPEPSRPAPSARPTDLGEVRRSDIDARPVPGAVDVEAHGGVRPRIGDEAECFDRGSRPRHWPDVMTWPRSRRPRGSRLGLSGASPWRASLRWSLTHERDCVVVDA